MIFIPFLKATGEIVPGAIQDSKGEQTFESAFGKNAQIYAQIYDSINLNIKNDKGEVDVEKEKSLFRELNKYKVDIETKKLVNKDKLADLNINYAPEEVVQNETEQTNNN